MSRRVSHNQLVTPTAEDKVVDESQFDRFGDSERRCGDCDAAPGELHMSGCDVERCADCGDQAIGCDCEDENLARLPWKGEWPGLREAMEAGFWCHWEGRVGGRGWVSCHKSHPEATPDLNRYAQYGHLMEN